MYLRVPYVYVIDERRPTVNELANQRGVAQKSSGWKLYHLAAQLEEMVSIVSDTKTLILLILSLTVF